MASPTRYVRPPVYVRRHLTKSVFWIAPIRDSPARTHFLRT